VIELQPVEDRNNRTGAIFFMDEHLLAECNMAGRISRAAADGNAGFASATGLPAIHEPESGDRPQVTAIPAVGGSRLQKISNPSASSIIAAVPVGAGARADSVTAIARGVVDIEFQSRFFLGASSLATSLG
jgi:hypothetical protein